MSGDEQRLLDEKIQRSIRSMKQEATPPGFTASVMSGLEPKRPGIWTRLKLWLTGPKSLTFTPIQAMPIAACAVLLIVFGLNMYLPESGSNNELRLSTVRFVLNDSARTARTVSVIGSFNDWQEEKSTMRYDSESGAWVLEASLPPGDHEYVFLVDGEKVVTDPAAAMTRDDGFGNKNSILFVNGDHEQKL